ncbi:MAG: elongation factor Ts [Planctomycetes bacterium]|nr:elongation factor Ts [Planctomycetota bacterium]
MADVSSERIRELRERTKAGVMACKKALEEAGGDLQRAEQILHARGEAARAKKVGRSTKEGVVGSYVHSNNKIGVLVELLCETDFAARTDDFQQCARNISMQIAAMDPVSVDRESVPADVLEQEKATYLEEVRDQPAEAQESHVAKKLELFFRERVLLEQAFIKDAAKTVKTLLEELTNKIGENIQIGRFVRFQIGS